MSASNDETVYPWTVSASFFSNTSVFAMTNPIKLLLEDLMEVRCARPFDVLGIHDQPDGRIVRVWRPDATSVSLINLGTEQRIGEMASLGQGIFELSLDNIDKPFVYRLEIIDKEQQSFTFVDPWQFASHVFSPVFVEPCRSYRYMGASPSLFPALPNRN